MSYNINVLSVIWLPVMADGETLDEAITGYSGTKTEALEFFAQKRTTTSAFMLEASHGEVTFTVVGNLEIWEALPLANGEVDYTAIINRITVDFLNTKQVDQIWLDSYTNNVVDTTQFGEETVMGSKWGNTSNSDISYNLPLADKTYIVVSFRSYNNNTCVIAHYIAHQLEFMLAKINKELFLNKFCGCDRISKPLIAQNGLFRCGNVHFPPNGTADYDYENETLVDSDILDWKPDGGGTISKINRETWGQYGSCGYHYGWLMFWFKHIPHSGNTLTYKGQPLTDWWRFLADWDGCMEGKVGLFIPAIVPTPAPTPTTPTTPTAPTAPSRNPCRDKIPNMPFPGAFPGTTAKLPIAPITPTTPIVNDQADPPKNYPNQLWEIKVLQLSYFPLTADGAKVDIGITGDVENPLAEMQSWVAQQSSRLVAALEEGCHKTINYRIMTRIEIHEPVPCTWGTEWRPQGYEVPLVDYRAIMKRFDITKWVNDGIKQVWIWAYHGDKVVLWESTMASKAGNISNSDRNKNEIPTVGDKSYTVFNFNYSRDASMALESHGHQMEAIWNWIDKREETDKALWKDLLFWGHFVGGDSNLRLVQRNGVYRCGWIHYCPNSVKDYDWFNPRVVISDIGDWRPEGGGATAQVSRNTWSAADDGGMAWKIAWMKAIPRANNGLSFKGKAVTNWWEFIADFDGAVKAGRKLAE